MSEGLVDVAMEVLAADLLVEPGVLDRRAWLLAQPREQEVRAVAVALDPELLERVRRQDEPPSFGAILGKP